MKFTTVKAMKLCPNSCEGWLTLLFHQSSSGRDIIVLDGLLRNEVLKPYIFFWKHTTNQPCKYEEKIA
jgi:hypothetical protein